MKLFSTIPNSENLIVQPNRPAENQLFTAYSVKTIGSFLYNMCSLNKLFNDSKTYTAVAITLLFSLLGSFVQAQTSTAAGGNWSAPGTWVGGVVPVAGNPVTIVGGATVTVDVATAACASLSINPNNNNATGTLSFNNTGVLTVTGNVTVGANGNRSGSISMANGGTLKVGGTFTAANLNTFTRGTGTIDYNGNAAQAVLAGLGIYNNLRLSGSGTKSISTGTSVAGSLSIAGTATASIAAGLNISVNSLSLAGINQANGTWGSTSSAAVNKNNVYFAATTGIITVTVDGRPVFTGLVNPPTITYGTATVSLSGTISASGPIYPVDGETVGITINGVTQSAVIAGGAGAFTIQFPTATFNVGNYTISYAYAGGANLAAAVANASTSITVAAASATVTANIVKKIYGTALTGAPGSLAFTAAGLQNGEIIGSVTINFSSGAGTGAAATSQVGTYTNNVLPSAATGGTFTASNYRITYVRAQLIVLVAPLTITANNQNKAYGVALAFSGTEFTSSGLLNGNTVSSVTLASAGAAAAATVAGSPYAIVASAATGTGLNNYSITYTDGILTITGISESIADYRSKAAGNFSAASSWEYDQGGNSWANATQAPTTSSNITILHNIILDQNHTTGAAKTFFIGTGGALTINPAITLDVDLTGTLNLNNQPVLIKSTVTGTGSIGKILGTLTGESNVTVERYIGGNKRAWRLLTIPVTGNTIREAWAGVAANPAAPFGEIAGAGTLITGHNYTVGSTAAAAGFDWFSGLGSTTSSSIRYYSQAAAWASASNTPNTNQLPSKQGYLLYVRGDRTIASNSGVGNTTLKPFGALRKGDQVIPVSESFTVVGNPYACAINLDDVYNNAGNSGVITRNFWVWDATLGTTGAYRALSWNGFDYDMTGGSGLAADYLVVNSGQAFFVEKASTGNITINENNKTTVAAPQLFRPQGLSGTVVSQLDISLYQATGTVLGSATDRVVARYNDLYSTSPSEGFDVVKLNNFNENLSLVRNNKYLSIESRPFPTERDTLYIPFWNLAQRSYAFKITSNKFIGVNQTARLIDAYTKTETFLEMNDGVIVYPFTVTSDPASSSLNRFKIVMEPAVVLAVNCTKFNAGLIGNKVNIAWSTGCEVGATDFVIEKSADGIIFNQLESVAAKNIATGANYQVFDQQPFKGKNFYRIRSNDKSGHFTYTSIALVQLNAKKGIQVMPTIVDNKRFNLVLNQQAAGKYNLVLTNLSGQQVYQSSITNLGGNSNFEVNLGNISVGNGVYKLSVVDTRGNMANFNLLINN